jgi:hypothetical protein
MSAACRGFSALGSRNVMDELESSALIERAVIATKQMRYFRLFIQRASFDELRQSMDRTGFVANYEDVEDKEASFRWAVGESDFLFFISFENPARFRYLQRPKRISSG